MKINQIKEMSQNSETQTLELSISYYSHSEYKMHLHPTGKNVFQIHLKYNDVDVYTEMIVYPPCQCCKEMHIKEKLYHILQP